VNGYPDPWLIPREVPLKGKRKTFENLTKNFYLIKSKQANQRALEENHSLSFQIETNNKALEDTVV
jgi:hypothetical protein